MSKAVLAVIFVTILMAVPVLAASEDSKSNLEKVMFVHYKNGAEKHYFATADTTTATSSSNCYKLMGVKWPSLPVSYVINPTNKEGLSSKFVTSAVSRAAETWDYSTSKELFRNTYSVDSSAKYGVQNYKNTISFGSYPSTSVIAITYVWYTKTTKQIVEFDMLFNSYFAWGNASTNRSRMDLQGIATHEFGHSIGLGDLYNSCTKETMYSYSTAGETLKRTLNKGDITGLRKIYG